MKNNKIIAFGVLTSVLCIASPLMTSTVEAEEPSEIIPEGGLTIKNYRGGNTFSRKVPTSIDVYAKKGTIPKVKYEAIEFNNTVVNVMSVDPDGENTILQLEYALGKPMYMNEFYDAGLTKDNEYYLVGGINGGFFNNNSLSADYGAPSGAVASNWKYINWSNGWTLTPGYGNGFTTAYFDNENPMIINYHGWNQGNWFPENDSILEYIDNGIRYNLPSKFGLSGAYALMIDGLPNNLGKDDSVYFNYNGGISAVTLFGQKEDGTYLLVTTEGGIGGGQQETKLMQELGAYNAYRLDGGGSSQMMFDKGLINYHEIVISNMDGTPSYSKAVKDGQTLEELEDPKREYYTFEGWYDDKECAANLSEEHKIDLSTYQFEDDTKLYAGWSRNRVKVSLNIDGQYFGEESFDQGNLYTPITVPSVENGWLGEKDKFIGWFIDPECTIPYLDTELVEGNEISLYGKVERQAPQKYSIKITTNEGGTVSPKDDISVNEGEEFVLTVLSDANYTIDKVIVNGKEEKLDANNQLKLKDIRTNIEIEVRFKQVKVNAIIKDENGTELFNDNVDIGYKVKIVDENGEFVSEHCFDENNSTLVLKTPTKQEKPFLNWNVEYSGNNVIIKPVYGEIYVYAVLGNVNGNGKIEGLGNYDYGSDVTLSVIPDQGYEIASVKLDGVDKGKVNSFTINDINKEHIVDVVFERIVYEEGKVSIRFVDGNKYNAQDLTGYNETIEVHDDGNSVLVDISAKIDSLESANYKIISNNVPAEISFENNGQVYEVVVDHNELVEPAPKDSKVTRSIEITYIEGNNKRSETIKQDGLMHFTNSRITDLVTNKIIADYDISYSFDALRMPEKDGYTLDVKEIPAVDHAESYTDEFNVVYTKNNIKKYTVEIVFVDVNSVDTFDLNGYNQKLYIEEGNVLNIDKFIKAVEDRGFIVNNDVSHEFTVDGDKKITINVVHGTSVTEEIKTYTFTRTIHYVFDGDKSKDYDTVQKTELNRKIISTKDNVTKKVTSKYEDTWNDTYLIPSITTQKVEGYTADKGFVNSLDLRSVNPEKDSTKFEVTVKYTKDKVETDKNDNEPSSSAKPTAKPTNKPTQKPTENESLVGKLPNGNNTSDKDKNDSSKNEPTVSKKPISNENQNELIDPEVTATPEESIQPTIIPLDSSAEESNSNNIWWIIGVVVAGVTVISLINFFTKKEKKEFDEDDLIVENEKYIEEVDKGKINESFETESNDAHEVDNDNED